MKEIPAKSVPTVFKKGGKQCHQLYVKNTKPMKADEFIDRFAKALGKSKANARYINDVHGQTLAESLAANRSVNTGTLRAFLVIGGSVVNPTAELTKEENPVIACLLPMGELKEAVADLVAVNVTKTIEAILYTVQSDGSDEVNTVVAGRTLVSTGVGIKLNPEASDEGAWMEDADGTIVTEKLTVTKNDTNLLEGQFDELPKPGTYVYVIQTRDGGSPDELGVTRLTRKVVVK